MDKHLKIVSWNLGNVMYPAEYAYDKAQDAIRKKNLWPVPKRETLKIIAGQIEILKQLNADIMLLQEISKLHAQNHFSNPLKQFQGAFPDYESFYCPTLNLGLINQGKATFIRGESKSKCLTIPYKLKGYFNNLLFANSNAIVTRIRSSGKDLVIFNIHPTPFARSRLERELQLQYVFSAAEAEYTNGHHVLIGGDWNVDMPAVKKSPRLQSIGSAMPDAMIKAFHAGKWKLAASNKPTLRDLGAPYTANSNMFSIDGFLLSPNIRLIEVNAINDFRFSDHCPVNLKIELL